MSFKSPFFKDRAIDVGKQSVQAKEEGGDLSFNVPETMKHTKVSLSMMDLLEYEEPRKQVIKHLISKCKQKQDWRAK